ncbi:MgtC/SapB family protein [Roseateles sp.]|uniref:MgtC/SapB family protein n=1 Tax=Roseateles sp. TaxID=1971397 RepID=UPI0025DE27B7|nr:MgtC/SapB family protein [Roseateles sp.]MBV8033744.1 MgtC/SapB family protein [Roseateles sp.]
MQAFQNLNLPSLLDTVTSVGAAFALGAAIGLERQWRQRTAGLRTNALVAVAAAVFVDMANRLGGHDAAVHVVAYVVSGVGFLGAGAIMKEGANVIGLNTAATLWGSAAVGACAGADLLAEALVATFFVLASNTLLRPVVNRINRRPLKESAGEASYVVQLVCAPDDQAELREQLVEYLEAAAYPVREVEARPLGDDAMELEARLFSTAVDPDELDRVMDGLRQLEGVRQAYWTGSSDE